MCPFCADAPYFETPNPFSPADVRNGQVLLCFFFFFFWVFFLWVDNLVLKHFPAVPRLESLVLVGRPLFF